MLKWFKRFRNSDKGQGMVEYGLILALVSIVSIGALGGIGDGVKGTFDKAMDAFGGNVPPQEEVGNEPVYTDEQINDLVKEGYIKVETAEDLNNVRNSLSGKYIQVKDIDLSGEGNFEPIGNSSAYQFKGVFDGGGYVISNLKVDKGSSDYAGLFGRTEGATFINIGLENVDVSGNNQVGGLVGRQNNSSITNSYATGNVTGNNWVGGLVGNQKSSSTVTNSYATGNVTGDSQVGGLVGYQVSSSEVTNSYATGNVTGTGSVGGLVGYQSSSSTTDSYSTGNVTGTGDDVGGLVGYQSSSSTTNSYATGTVTGTNYVGGLVGRQLYSPTVTSSYYDTETTNQSDTGKGEGKSTAEMKNKDTYAGWDFESIWIIESGQYPTHK